MSSLVTYDDSEDESCNQTEEEQSDPSGFNSVNVKPRPAGSETVLGQSSSSLLYVYPKIPHWDRKYHSRNEGKHFKDRSACLTFSKSVADGSNPAKRRPSSLPGVRPYIPKRQRQSEETKCPENHPEHSLENPTRKDPVLFDVSPKVKPYLGEKPKSSGTPRKLLMSLEGHQGAANTVQWCPLPHVSHLLLSASMDKTFKVMTAPTYC